MNEEPIIEYRGLPLLGSLALIFVGWALGLGTAYLLVLVMF